MSQVDLEEFLKFLLIIIILAETAENEQGLGQQIKQGNLPPHCGSNARTPV